MILGTISVAPLRPFTFTYGPFVPAPVLPSIRIIIPSIYARYITFSTSSYLFILALFGLIMYPPGTVLSSVI